MATVNIQLPAIEAENEVEIEIKINGSARHYHYKVEIIPWDECTNPDDRIGCLRESIARYSPGWQLIQIGAATDNSIPLTFRAAETGLSDQLNS